MLFPVYDKTSLNTRLCLHSFHVCGYEAKSSCTAVVAMTTTLPVQMELVRKGLLPVDKAQKSLPGVFNILQADRPLGE